MEEAKRLGTFISLHEEDPELNGILGLNENIAKEHFHVCGATGVAEYSMAARDAMIAMRQVPTSISNTFPRKKVSRWVGFAQGLGARDGRSGTSTLFENRKSALD